MMRLVLRSVLDSAALYCAWAIQFAASRNYAAAFITAIAVGLYGMWCFYDGKRSAPNAQVEPTAEAAGRSGSARTTG